MPEARESPNQVLPSASTTGKFMVATFPFHRSITTAFLCAALAACATDRPWASDGGARQIYSAGNQALRSGDYDTAIRAYQELAKVAPPPALGSQADAEMAYSYYKQRDYPAALNAANEFLQRYPTHPRADYVHYLRAVASLQVALAIEESDAADRASALGETYGYLQDISQQFPFSGFNEKALRSLVFVRQQLARAHLDQAKSELLREDTSAALTLARYVEEEFRGTPAAHDATALIADPVAVQRDLAAKATPPATPMVANIAPTPALPQPNTAPPSAATAIMNTAPGDDMTAQPNAASSPTATASSSSSEHRIPIHDPQWIMQQNPERYTVELVPAASEEAVRTFVDTHNIHGSARYPSTADRDRNTLIHGLYPDANSARMAANQLIKRWGLRDAPVRRFAEVQSSLNDEK